MYLLYQTDQNCSNSSKVLFCMCKTKDKVLSLLWKKYKNVLLNEEMKFNLRKYGNCLPSEGFQTGFTLEYIPINKLLE